MISVKDAVTDLDRMAAEASRKESQVRRMLGWWAESITAVEQHVFPLFPAAAKVTAEDWRQLRAAISPECGTEILETCPRLTERVLHAYALAARGQQRSELDAVKEIIEVLAEAAQGVRQRNDTYGQRFEQLTESLGELARIEDPDQLRIGLAREAAALRTAVVSMVEENRLAIAGMADDLSVFQKRLAEAETAACTDPLTGLANRRRLESALEERIARGSVFCVLLFDMDGFKGINDRLGHACGDQVLRIFARILNEQVRPGDLVARWGGDEFFVLLDCGIKDALRRSQQIAQRLSTRYDVTNGERTLSVPISASAGVVEHRTGESAAELFRRADQAMYAAKPRQAR